MMFSLVPSTTSTGVGGWFGDVLDGVKQPTIDALGFKIREVSGAPDPFQFTPVPAFQTTSAQPQVVEVQRENNDMMLIMFAVMAVVLLSDDD